MRRITGISLAIALALGGTLALVAYVGAAEDRALAGTKTVDVFVVAKAVEAGTPAEDVKGSVSTERVPAKVRAEGAVSALADLEGMVVAVDLVPGEQLVTARFVKPDDLEAISGAQVPDGLHQLTVALDPERAIGGQLRNGSTVGVFASFQGDSGEDPNGAGSGALSSTHLILHKVKVTSVQVEQAPADTADGEDAPKMAPTGKLLVTLAVDAPSAERVVFAAEHGSLWLSVEPGDAPEGGTQIWTRGSVY